MTTPPALEPPALRQPYDAPATGVRVLDAALPAERQAWLDAWNRWPDREVMAHPCYASLFARAADRCLCAVASDGDDGVLFPFILRPLSAEPWSAGSDATDLVTPYGYGGPFAWGAPDAAGFWRGFQAWADAAGVVSAFVRLSLFEEQLLPLPWESQVQQQNVVRSLDLPPDDLWRDYEHKVRKNVKRARRDGITVEMDPQGDRLDAFQDVYDDTMDRRGAGRRYRFPPSFFRRIVDTLPGGFMFFHALSGDDVVSTELVLLSARRSFSFLGGTRAGAFASRPNDLLKHAIIEWSRDAGLREFVLGGGAQPADGIFRYKQSFAPAGVRPFRVVRHVFRPDEYRRLVELRGSAAPGTQPASDFFPAYRG